MQEFTKVTFQKRPVAIPADYRPLYRIGQILLILNISSRSGKASLLKIHLLQWALKSEDNRSKLTGLVYGEESDSLVIWGFDPAVNRALQFAVAQGLCEQVDRSYKILPKGKSLVLSYLKDGSIFEFEKTFLQQFGKTVTEEKIVKMTHKWVKIHVEN